MLHLLHISNDLLAIISNQKIPTVEKSYKLKKQQHEVFSIHLPLIDKHVYDELHQGFHVTLYDVLLLTRYQLHIIRETSDM